MPHASQQPLKEQHSEEKRDKFQESERSLNCLNKDLFDAKKFSIFPQVSRCRWLNLETKQVKNKMTKSCFQFTRRERRKFLSAFMLSLENTIVRNLLIGILYSNKPLTKMKLAQQTSCSTIILSVNVKIFHRFGKQFVTFAGFIKMQSRPIHCDAVELPKLDFHFQQNSPHSRIIEIVMSFHIARVGCENPSVDFLRNFNHYEKK
jgi:hypothetical protein